MKLIKLLIIICLISLGLSRKFKKSHSHKSKITHEDKAYIVNTHNYYRNLVASGNLTGKVVMPKAKNMLQMYWHEGLATKAHELASKCHNRPSGLSDRQIREMNFAIGENYKLAGKGEKTNWAGVIGHWFEENQYFKGRQTLMKVNDKMSKYSDSFTQMIWANSYMIGCSVHTCKDNFLYVCLYGPGGNLVGQSIYLDALQPDLLCPRGLVQSPNYPSMCCHPSLCGKGIIDWSGNYIEFDKRKKKK
jgi:hypothetical protein